jgi:hypothetical protein
LKPNHQVEQLAVQGNRVLCASAGGQHTAVLIKRKEGKSEWAALLETIQHGRSGAGTSAADYRQQLVDLYTTHNPEKVHSIDKFLLKYSGREQQLVDAVRNKYE